MRTQFTKKFFVFSLLLVGLLAGQTLTTLPAHALPLRQRCEDVSGYHFEKFIRLGGDVRDNSRLGVYSKESGRTRLYCVMFYSQALDYWDHATMSIKISTKHGDKVKNHPVSDKTTDMGYAGPVYIRDRSCGAKSIKATASLYAWTGRVSETLKRTVTIDVNTSSCADPKKSPN